jgi:hypothetical protein
MILSWQITKMDDSTVTSNNLKQEVVVKGKKEGIWTELKIA